MTTRVVLSEDVARAMKVRGLNLSQLAERSRISLPTVSSAVNGKPINVASAQRICRALVETPVVEELDRWVEETRSSPAA